MSPALTAWSTRQRNRIRGVLFPLFCAVAVLAAAAVPAAGAPSDSAHPPGQGGSVVRTDHGLVRGVSHGSYSTYDGIPYAAPPTGSLRWRPPGPVATWRGVRDATVKGQRCVQMPAPGAVTVVGAEDCLYLNVTTPTPTPKRAGGKRPVLVWMHGGAFLGGSGNDYSAEKLAVRGDTVVVTVNYRLGIFGYFAHAGLGSAPPFGLADQQSALRWVRANAEHFGVIRTTSRCSASPRAPSASVRTSPHRRQPGSSSGPCSRAVPVSCPSRKAPLDPQHRHMSRSPHSAMSR